MNRTPMKLSDAQIKFLAKAMEGGNSNVSSTLEMLTGQTVDRHSVRINVIRGGNLIKLMHFLWPGPLATVICNLSGDVEGDFLFLQSERDFETLSQVMGPNLTAHARQTINEANLVPDWLKEQRHKKLDGMEPQTQMLDVISELGNVLFGIYLAALYDTCNLATFQGVPNATLMDSQQSALKKAVFQNRKESNIAIVIEIEYVIVQKSLKAWLLMLPLMSGLRAMLDSMDTAS